MDGDRVRTSERGAGDRKATECERGLRRGDDGLDLVARELRDQVPPVIRFHDARADPVEHDCAMVDLRIGYLGMHGHPVAG